MRATTSPSASAKISFSQSSRRHPALLNSHSVSQTYPQHATDNCWGFTILRREQATATSKIPVLTYLAPLCAQQNPRKGSVLRFEAPDMPLLPKGDNAYQRRVSWGTLMKLYAYQLKSTGNVLRRDGALQTGLVAARTRAPYSYA
jgi:hypothetical protein